eukprot:16391552-Heterocapsa_arctica.AAC.1
MSETPGYCWDGLEVVREAATSRHATAISRPPTDRHTGDRDRRGGGLAAKVFATAWPSNHSHICNLVKG